MEVWKNIFDNYEVSNLGNVRSLPRLVDNGYVKRMTKLKYLKQIKKKEGYLVVKINKRLHYVHRLVAELFIGNTGKDQVNHIDGNKSNNIYSNLEWVNNSENQLHYLYILGGYNRRFTKK